MHDKFYLMKIIQLVVFDLSVRLISIYLCFLQKEQEKSNKDGNVLVCYKLHETRLI